MLLCRLNISWVLSIFQILSVNTECAMGAAEHACVDSDNNIHVLTSSPRRLHTFDAGSSYSMVNIVDLEPLLGSIPCTSIQPQSATPGLVLHTAGAGAIILLDPIGLSAEVFELPESFHGSRVGRSPAAAYFKRVVTGNGRRHAENTKVCVPPDADPGTLYVFRRGTSEIVGIDLNKRSCYQITLPFDITSMLACNQERFEVSHNNGVDLLTISKLGDGSKSATLHQAAVARDQAAVARDSTPPRRWGLNLPRWQQSEMFQFHTSVPMRLLPQAIPDTQTNSAAAAESTWTGAPDTGGYRVTVSAEDCHRLYFRGRSPLDLLYDTSTEMECARDKPLKTSTTTTSAALLSAINVLAVAFYDPEENLAWVELIDFVDSSVRSVSCARLNGPFLTSSGNNLLAEGGAKVSQLFESPKRGQLGLLFDDGRVQIWEVGQYELDQSGNRWLDCVVSPTGTELEIEYMLSSDIGAGTTGDDYTADSLLESDVMAIPILAAECQSDGDQSSGAHGGENGGGGGVGGSGEGGGGGGGGGDGTGNRQLPRDGMGGYVKGQMQFLELATVSGAAQVTAADDGALVLRNDSPDDANHNMGIEIENGSRDVDDAAHLLMGSANDEHPEYQRLKAEVSVQIKQLGVIFESLEAKEKEREWVRNKAAGDLDESKLVDGVAGEQLIYRLRGEPDKQAGLRQRLPKRLVFALDCSQSMNRGNGTWSNYRPAP